MFQVNCFVSLQHVMDTFPVLGFNALLKSSKSIAHSSIKGPESQWQLYPC